METRTEYRNLRGPTGGWGLAEAHAVCVSMSVITATKCLLHIRVSAAVQFDAIVPGNMRQGRA